MSAVVQVVQRSSLKIAGLHVNRISNRSTETTERYMRRTRPVKNQIFAYAKTWRRLAVTVCKMATTSKSLFCDFCYFYFLMKVLCPRSDKKTKRPSD